MVRPAYRTTKLRKKTYKTPSGKVKKAYIRRIKGKSTCRICDKNIRQKRKNRPYAKELCHTCTQTIIKLKTRIKNNEIKITDTDIKYKKYLTQKGKK